MGAYKAANGKIRCNIMASGKLTKGYREHTTLHDCLTLADGKKFAEKRKKVIEAMLDGDIPMDEPVKNWYEKRQRQKYLIEAPPVYTVDFLCLSLEKEAIRLNLKTLTKILQHAEIIKAYFGEEKDIKVIQKKDIVDFLNTVKERKNKKGKIISNATLNRYLSTIRRAFNILIEDDKINFWVNPCKGIKKLTEVEKKKLILPKDLEDQFFAAFRKQDELQRDIFFLDLYTGFRISNVSFLSKDQIDIEKERIYIAPELNKGKKNIKKKINHKAMEIIKKYYYEADFYLFVYKRTGKPPKDMRHSFKNAARAIGLPDLTPHDIRRTVGTRVYKNTKDIDVARRVLDQSDIGTAMRYIITEESEEDKALDEISI